jgi:perosamine synthetase
MTDRRMISVAEPDLSVIERNYLIEAFDSKWISSSGNFVDRFETAWAEICETQYALSVSNGTVALHLILAALKIGPGDEVIVPSMTFVASANAVTYVGAKPIFVDSHESTWCINTQLIEELITPNTRAIMAVHLYGNPCDMSSLDEICKRRGIHLIEDAAEAPFAEVNGRRVGSFGAAASFSFYGNKILTSGEGGAVTTSDFELYSRMKMLRGQGMDPNRRYFFPEIGYNFRLTNMQCAILCGQIERQDVMLNKRRQIFEIYDEFLFNVPDLEFQAILPDQIRSPWLYTCVIKNRGDVLRDSIIDKLRVRRIETRPIFVPLHQLPPYKSVHQRELPVADYLGKCGISLPTSSTMNFDEVRFVAKEFVAALGDV